MQVISPVRNEYVWHHDHQRGRIYLALSCLHSLHSGAKTYTPVQPGRILSEPVLSLK